MSKTLFILKENQIKKLIGNILLEQQTITNNSTTVNIFPKTPLGNLFSYGEFQSEKVKDYILTNLKPRIEDFIAKSDSAQFTIKISAGESLVTNPKGFETRGSLALARANSVNQYFQEAFGDLIKNGVIKIESPNNVSKVQIGTTPYEKGDQNNPNLVAKYKAEQFVNFEIVGSGTKTEVKTTTLCETEPLRSSGGYIMADNDYTNITNWNLGKGSGDVYIMYDVYQQLDILYFEYNGQIYGDTLFHGSTGDTQRIFLGTSLRAKYGNGTLPNQMANNTFIPLNQSDSRIFKSLDDMGEWGLVKSFQNTFGPNSSLHNPQYMAAFQEFDETKNKSRLIKNLGVDFPWGYLDSKIGKKEVTIGPFKKVDGIDTIKVINVAPVGTTGWVISLVCTNNP
jgi:hypothetical protein